MTFLATVLFSSPMAAGFSGFDCPVSHVGGGGSAVRVPACDHVHALLFFNAAVTSTRCNQTLTLTNTTNPSHALRWAYLYLTTKVLLW